MYAELPLKSIVESPTNPRKDFGDLAELTDSIRRKGILQPVTVRKSPKGHELVFGHRRFRAAAAAGLETIPALVREMTDEEVLEAQLIENCQRSDIHPMEEAEVYRQLIASKTGYDAERIAARVGKSIKYVYDRLKLLSLTKEAQALFRNGEIAAGHAILLARLKPADQARAIGQPGAGPLLFFEDLLWDPEEADDDALGKRSNRPETFKAISVRELQAWIDEHVRFDVDHVEPMLFPETAQTIQAVREDAEKIVPITHDYHVIPEAKDDSTRTYGPMSWRRADGAGKTKTCPHSVTGVIVVGPGRGEAFKVCVQKKKCAVHWGAEQRAAKKAAADGGKSAADSWAERQRREQARHEEQYKQEQAEQKRWQTAVPAILEAVAAAVKKAPATAARGVLADLIIDAFDRQPGPAAAAAVKLVPRGKTAEDLVRHAAFLILCREAHEWDARTEFPKLGKALGVNVTQILDKAAPPADAPAPAKPAKGKQTKKARA